MMISPIARELNSQISDHSQSAFDALSELGKKMYFPKGIVSQGNEAKQKAHNYNATLGVAWEHNKPMMFEEVFSYFNHLDPADIFPYAPTEGRKKLRQQWKEQLYAKNPSLKGKKISLPLVTNGITHSISLAADLFCDEGDTLLLPTPFWGNYRLLFDTVLKAEIETFPLFDEAMKGLNLAGFGQKLESILRKKNKVLILLNFPNNPTGYTPYQSEFDQISEILLSHAEAGKRIVVMNDDAYFGLNFDDCAKESIFAGNLGLHPNLIGLKLDGCTKEDYAWGFRCGFLTFGIHCENPEPVYAALEKKAGGLIRAKNSNLNHAAQAIMESVFSREDYLKSRHKNFVLMQNRAAETKRILKNPKYAKHFSAFPFNSGYFMCVKLKNLDSETLRLHLLERYGIGTISIDKDILRIAFCSVDQENLEDLFEKIHVACNELS